MYSLEELGKCDEFEKKKNANNDGKYKVGMLKYTLNKTWPIIIKVIRFI